MKLLKISEEGVYSEIDCSFDVDFDMVRKVLEKDESFTIEVLWQRFADESIVIFSDEEGLLKTDIPTAIARMPSSRMEALYGPLLVGAVEPRVIPLDDDGEESSYAFVGLSQEQITLVKSELNVGKECFYDNES